MALKHKITINVTDARGRHTTVLRGAKKKHTGKISEIPVRGFYTGLSLAPGQTVESVDVREVKEGGST